MCTYVGICSYYYYVHWQEEGEGTLVEEGRGPEDRCCLLPRWGGAGRLREGRRALLSREAGQAGGPWPEAGGMGSGGTRQEGENTPSSTQLMSPLLSSRECRVLSSSRIHSGHRVAQKTPSGRRWSSCSRAMGSRKVRPIPKHAPSASE